MTAVKPTLAMGGLRNSQNIQTLGAAIESGNIDLLRGLGQRSESQICYSQATSRAAVDLL